MGNKKSKHVKKDNTVKSKLLIAGAAVLVILICGLSYFTSKHLYNGRFAPNIFIEDVEVSNMTKKEALEILNAKYPKKDLVLKYSDNTYVIEPKDVNLEYNTEAVVEQAYNSTREGFYFKNIFAYIDAKFNGKDYVITPSYAEDKIDKIVKNISKDINRDYTNAKLSISSSISVIPSKTGLKCDNEANKEAIKNQYIAKTYENIDLKVDKVEPKIKTKDLESIDGKLGSYSTTFNAYLTGRTYNIALALSRCSGQIIMPGETFSYNDSTGPRVLSNGFKNASIILFGEYQDAPGGGVCQGSTTIFNAVLLSGLEITEVHNHSKTAAYVPRGRDAMVNDGDSDFKFTNNFKHPVYLACFVSGNKAYATVYGCTKDKGTVGISTKNFVVRNLPAATTYRTITKNGKSKTTKIYTAVYQE